LSCKNCGYSLVGERQKGHVYYRCQIRDCPTMCIREEAIEQAVLGQFVRLRFSDEERAWFRSKLAQMKLTNTEEQEKIVVALKLQLSQIEDRLNRLTDAYIDRLVEKDLFEQRKKALLVERMDAEQKLAEWKRGRRNPADELLFFLERADSAYLAYKLGLVEEKRDLLDTVTSNRMVSGKTPEIMLALPFDEIANRFERTSGGPSRSIPRTWNALIKRLLEVVPGTQLSVPSLPTAA
jgi:hypothetical protein